VTGPDPLSRPGPWAVLLVRPALPLAGLPGEPYWSDGDVSLYLGDCMEV